MPCQMAATMTAPVDGAEHTAETQLEPVAGDQAEEHAADEGAGKAGHKGHGPVDTGTLTIEQELVDGADGQAEAEDSE